MAANKLAWILRRLLAMSPREVLHRVAEAGAKTTGKRMQGWANFELPDADLHALEFDVSGLKKLSAVCGQDWAEIYRTTQNKKWLFLGQEWPGQVVGSVWHLDPVSQLEWPKDIYGFDVDYRHEARRGDIKYVWELNRLQFLPPIAALARATNDAEAERFCIATILDWAEQNPPFKGVNWVSGIELSLRAISIVLTVSLIGWDRINVKEQARIGAILNAHAVWLARYPSRFSSANNHLIAEATGLYVLGSLIPSLPKAVTYRAYGKRVLIDEVSKQILDDGVGAEQSPTYTAFALEFYLIAMATARTCGDNFPASVGSQLRKALEFLRWITDDGGNQPRIGDDDDSQVILSGQEHEQHYVSGIMACLANQTVAGELAPPIKTPQLRNLFFGAMPPYREGPKGWRSFDTGGYSVFRHQIHGRNTMLVFDHGPLGYLSIAAHGHADALSIWLHIDEHPVIVDAGTYLYHSGGKERDYFRGTSAHNTLTLNNTDQSTISGAFNWSKKANAWRVTDELSHGQSVKGRHDGYQKNYGIVHERLVACLEADTSGNIDGFSITDRLLGELNISPATSNIQCLFAPNLDLVRTQENRVEVARAGVVLVAIDVEMDGQPTPGVEITKSAFSPKFGIKQNADSLSIRLSTFPSGTAVDTKMRLLFAHKEMHAKISEPELKS